MGRLERKIDADAVAVLLATGLTPHKRGRRVATHPPLGPKPSKWPSPAYAEKLRRKRRRAA